VLEALKLVGKIQYFHEVVVCHGIYEVSVVSKSGGVVGGEYHMQSLG
jgi:hypothetical protein